MFSAYYLLQGLFVGLTFIVLPVYLTRLGAATELVAIYAATTTLPLVLKVFAGPLMDRFTFAPMGARRPWILCTQLSLLVACCGLLFISDAIAQFWWMLAICTVMNTFAFVGDVAVDGLAISTFPEDERGRANAFMTGGLVSGMALITALSTTLLSEMGVPGLGLLLAGYVGLLFLASLIFRERPGDRRLPWSEGDGAQGEARLERSLRDLFHDLFWTMAMPTNLLIVAVMFLNRATYGIYKVWAPDLGLRVLGYSDADYTHWNSIALLAFVPFGIALGSLFDRWGVQRSYRVMLLVAGLGYVSLFLITPLLTDPRVAVGCMFALEAIDGITFIPYLAIGMALCRVEISATQFACYAALGNLGISAGSALYPYFVGLTGAMGIYWLNAGIYFACWALVTRFSLERHKAAMSRMT